MSEDQLGQCTFPCVEVCSRAKCPHKELPPKKSFPTGAVLASGFAATMAVLSSPAKVIRPPTPTPIPPRIDPNFPQPAGINSTANSLAEYLNLCLTEGWQSLIPFSSLEDIFLYFFPEFDYTIPENILEDNPLLFLYHLLKASESCDLDFFLELSNSEKIDVWARLSADTGGLVNSQNDYAYQVLSRLVGFGGTQLPTMKPNATRYVFPYFLEEFSDLIMANPEELVFLMGDTIPVMAQPRTDSDVLVHASSAYIPAFNHQAYQDFTQAQRAAMQASSGWVPVILANGTAGYVSSQYAYPSHDSRLIVTRTGEVWAYEFVNVVRHHDQLPQ